MDSAAVRKTLIAALAGVIGVLLVAVGFLGRVAIEPAPQAAPPAPPAATVTLGDTEFDFAILSEILAILEEDFVEPERVDEQLLYEGAIQGLFDALGDPHSTYIDPVTYAISGDEFSGTFQGIGATVQQGDDFIVIVAPLPDTPAARAGLRPGDLILEVNGESAEGWTVEKAVLKIRGPRGTSVTLRIRHTDSEEELVTVVRDEIVVRSVDTQPRDLLTGRPTALLDAGGNEVSDLAYIHIAQFTRRTPDEMEEAIEEAVKQGVRGLIVDLRRNPGGLLVETAETVDMFLDEGLILIQVDRDGTERTIEARPGTVTDLPMVIVQDQFSASGSEVMAAALQENGRATVVGTQSFGKGTVNHARDLSNGGAVYVSIARWLTPARNQIEGAGVTPDIEVQLTAEDVEEGRDVALFRAIDVLRAMFASTEGPAAPG